MLSPGSIAAVMGLTAKPARIDAIARHHALPPSEPKDIVADRPQSSDERKSRAKAGAAVGASARSVGSVDLVQRTLLPFVPPLRLILSVVGDVAIHPPVIHPPVTVTYHRHFRQTPEPRVLALEPLDERFVRFVLGVLTRQVIGEIAVDCFLLHAIYYAPCPSRRRERRS